VAKQYPEGRGVEGALYLKGNCLQAKRRYDEAVKAYSQLIAVSPAGEFADKARRKICWAQYFKGDTKVALESATTFLASHSDGPLAGEALFLIGLIHTDERRYADAAASFEESGQKHPDGEFAADALFNLGRAYEEMNKHPAAATTMKKFAVKYASDKRATEAMFRSARAAVQAETLDNAVAAYKEIASSTSAPKVREDALYCLGLAYLEADRMEEMTETFTEVLMEFPGTSHADEIYYTLGRTFLLQGNYRRAVANLENVGKQDPKSPHRGGALADLGYAYLRQERHDDAARALTEVIRSYPEIALTEQTYLWLGEHLFGEGEFESAKRVFAAFSKTGPKAQQGGLAALRIAQCDLHTNSLGAARQGFESVLTDFREYYGVDAEYGLGACLAKEEKYDDALRHLSSVLEQDEGETAARAQMEIGNVHFTKKEFETASTQCFEKMGNSPEAAKFYEELIEKYPDSSYAVKARAGE
jgi:TolA-binding protein